MDREALREKYPGGVNAHLNDCDYVMDGAKRRFQSVPELIQILKMSTYLKGIDVHVTQERVIQLVHNSTAANRKAYDSFVKSDKNVGIVNQYRLPRLAEVRDTIDERM